MYNGVEASGMPQSFSRWRTGGVLADSVDGVVNENGVSVFPVPINVVPLSVPSKSPGANWQQ